MLLTDLHHRSPVVFFPLALKSILGRFEVCHALPYFFAFERLIFRFGWLLRCERFRWLNLRSDFQSEWAFACLPLEQTPRFPRLIGHDPSSTASRIAPHAKQTPQQRDFGASIK